MSLFKPTEPKESIIYTEDQLMARLKFFIGICLSLTLTGIVFVVLYSLIFVTQPLNAISPIDQKFFELIVPIATFLTGTLSGIMLAGGDKEASKMALQAATRPTTVSPPPTQTPPTPFGGSSAPSFNKPMMPSMPAAPVFGAAPVAAAPVVGFGGKLAPPPAEEPEI